MIQMEIISWHLMCCMSSKNIVYKKKKKKGVNSLPLKQVWTAYLSSRCEQPTSQAGVVRLQVDLEFFEARLPRVELSIRDADVAVRPSGASLVGEIEHTGPASQMTAEIGLDAPPNAHAPVHGTVHGDHVMCGTRGVERFWFAVLVTCSCQFAAKWNIDRCSRRN